MKKFRVTVTETLKRFVEVEAENEDEAAEKVDFMYDNEDIVLTADDYYATNITVDELPRTGARNRAEAQWIGTMKGN